MSRGLDLVTTPRMRGERLGPGHLAALAPILADPRVGATMGGVALARPPQRLPEPVEGFRIVRVPRERAGERVARLRPLGVGEVLPRGRC